MAGSAAGGNEIAGFRLETEIARGGMGVVYRAHELRLERTVAVKLLAPELARDERFRARFLREAQLAAQLEHPHVLPVYQAGEADGVLFLATRYLEGDDLGAVLARDGRLAEEAALALLEQVADAIDAAHESGLLHRDIKPANVLVAGDCAYLADFGLARTIEPMTQWTEAGSVVGTVSYLAPEVIEGQDATAASDLYAFACLAYACLAYACLAGRPPFDGAHDAAVLYAHLKREPPPLPSQLARFDRVFARALAKDAAARHESAGEFVAELRRAARPAAGGPRALPLPPTPLVGRDRELGELRALATRTDVRLVTLTGPGGAGKTRLALALAEQLQSSHRDGACLCELATIREPLLALTTVAHAVGADQPGSGPLLDDLRATLQDRELLLVLDNLEQVLDVGPAVAELLARCPALTVVATSRTPLHLSAEHEYPVGQLAVDAAVELFRERALAVRPDFVPDADVAEICERLDRLPLAIELAAARTKALGTRAILERLDRRLRLLTGGARDLPARQQTLTAALDWSYQLLSADEQRLFRALGVFAGSFSLEAAEAVCDCDLDTIAALVDKSLVRVDGERFGLLETVREFAASLLDEQNETGELRRRHAEWVLAFAREADRGFDTPDVHVWYDRTEAEIDEIRAALAWTEAIGDAELQLEIAVSIFAFWANRAGWGSEGARWLESALARSKSRRTALYARALRARWLAPVSIGGRDGVLEALEESLAIYRELGDDREAGITLVDLGLHLHILERDDDAQRTFLEAASLGRDAGDAEVTAFAQGNLAVVLLNQGQDERALALLDEAMTAYRELGLTAYLAWIMQNRALAFLAQGDAERARAANAEALTAGAALKEPTYVAGCLVVQAALAARDRAHRQAAVLLGAAAALAENASVPLEPIENELIRETTDAATGALGNEGFQSGHAEGLTLTLGEAVELALRL